MSLTRSQIVVFGSIALVIIVFVLIFAGVIPGLQKKETQPNKIKANLNFWIFGDLPSNYETAVALFRKKYPNVEIKFQSFNNASEYEGALLEALAAGAGPDIFMIHRGWVIKHANKIFPLPTNKFSLNDLRNLFPQVVEQDFAPGGNIYALPLSIDTLAMIYNRDLIDAAAVPPPTTWEEFKEAVPRLAKINQAKVIERAGAAIGGAKNIESAADILNLLMLQSGVKMISGDYKTATFYGTGGKDALLFYTQFANAGSPLYTWNESLPKSIDLFAQEGVVIIFNYAAAIPEIKSRNAFLNFAVAPVPQPAAGKDKPFSYPNYWGYTVSRQSRYADLAWDFIISMATLPQSAEDYLNRSGKPPALKSLIYQNLNDPDLGVFARQALTAHRAAWPTPDQNKVDEIFVDAILNVVQNRMAADEALLQAQDRVTQLLSRFF